MQPPPTTSVEKSKWNQEAVQSNNKILSFSRTTSACVSGAVAGILGLTGINGFLFYFLSYAFLCVCLTFKLQFQFEKYVTSIISLYLGGSVEGLLSFIFFWTLFYDIVYIY